MHSEDFSFDIFIFDSLLQIGGNILSSEICSSCLLKILQIPIDICTFFRVFCKLFEYFRLNWKFSLLHSVFNLIFNFNYARIPSCNYWYSNNSCFSTKSCSTLVSYTLCNKSSVCCYIWSIEFWVRKSSSSTWSCLPSTINSSISYISCNFLNFIIFFILCWLRCF